MGKSVIVAFATFVATLLATSVLTLAAPRSDNTAATARQGLTVNRVRPLAERGNARAQAQLGFLYEHGRGLPQDHVAAVYWYARAADQGHPTAQYLLGLMYDKGHGVPRNDMLAYTWLNLAAARAQPGVREYYLRIRDAVAAKLTPAQVAKAQWSAHHFVPASP
jgi:TPR repeat protein